MSLNKAIEDLKFDSRLTEINIKLGRLSAEEVQKKLASLEDLESQVEKLDLEKSEPDNSL